MRKICLDTVDSTNTYARRLLKQGEIEESESVLITAAEQTAGRGRTGKSFSSIRGNGLYMTVVFPVRKKPEECLFITAAAAVAVCGCLHEAGCGEAAIKWVNDIYLKDRKVCGILTEAVTNAETGIMKSCILGVGINLDVSEECFPEELRKKAGSVKNLNISREELAEKTAGRILEMIPAMLDSPEQKKKMLEQYRRWSMIPGRTVFWTEAEQEMTGLAEGIDEEARLVVRTDRGIRILDSGYVSIRF